jgi:FADH2 O2-dependent halogenase
LPSTAGFVDPLLSTGFPLTLLGVSRLAEIIERDWETDNFNSQLESYSSQTDAELLATSRLIGALYVNMGNFPVFASLSLLYFAAASYSEAARRLGKPHLAPFFLLHDHPQFGPNFARVLERACSVKRGSESNELIEEVFRIIEPIDVAGLGNRERQNWYPVEAEDLLGAAPKVGATRDEIMQMLGRCGFWPATSLV